MNYLTLQEVKTRAGINTNTHDAKIERVIEIASAVIERIAGREFGAVTVVENEYHTSRKNIVLNNERVQSIQLVEVRASDDLDNPVWNEVTSYSLGDGIFKTGNRCLIFGEEVPTEVGGNVRVSYTYGSSEVPESVKDLCFKIANRLFKKKQREGASLAQIQEGLKSGDMENIMTKQERQALIALR
jgi:hypothetical protein